MAAIVHDDPDTGGYGSRLGFITRDDIIAIDSLPALAYSISTDPATDRPNERTNERSGAFLNTARTTERPALPSGRKSAILIFYHR